MIEFICLFLPAVLTIKKEDFKELKIYTVKKYVQYNLLINSIILLILDIKNNGIPLSLGEERFNVHFSVQYLILALILSLILPKIVNTIKSNIRVSFKGKRK